ncbi:YncE family protein [Pseudorhodoferax sp.]|uniref:YncE family protein n=1 Tax=Pseudorhodoferax sp. TaxID=1993553 RepID=UPI002DD630AF|nr:YncE family protein [Pseudorhodoferax sp.]
MTASSVRLPFALAACALAAVLAGCAQPATVAQAPAAVAATPAVQRQAFTQGAYELAYSARQNAVYAVFSGGFGATAAPSKVLKLDPATLAVQAEIPLERKGFGVALDDAAGRLYVGNTVDTSVTVVDLASGKAVGLVQLMQKVKTADGKERYSHDLRELVVDAANHRLYVTGHSFEGSVLFVVDTKTLQVVKTVPGLGKTKAPGLVLDAAGSRVFTSNLFGEILVIDTNRLEVVRRIQTEIEQPMNLVYDAPSKRLFATDQGLQMIRSMQEKGAGGFKSVHPGNRVAVVDVESGKLVHSIPTGAGPLALLLDASRNRLYVTERSGGTVSAYDSRSYQRLGTAEVPALPNSLALDARSNTLYVSIKNGEKEPKGSAESVARVRF